MDEELSFGAWLQRRRRALDLTQAALAQRVGLSRSAIRKFETGERRPSRQVAELLAEALAITLGERDLFLQVARGERPVSRLGGAAPPDTNSGRRGAWAAPALPSPATPLVGREAELADLARLLTRPHVTLLTLGSYI